MTIVLTHHALDRIKARTNFSPTRAQEIAEEAYYCGKDIKDFKNEKETDRALLRRHHDAVSGSLWLQDFRNHLHPR